MEYHQMIHIKLDKQLVNIIIKKTARAHKVLLDQAEVE